MALLSEELVAAAIQASDMLIKEAVLQRLPEIFRSHVVNIAGPDAATRHAAK
jgi:hypothetical protein